MMQDHFDSKTGALASLFMDSVNAWKNGNYESVENGEEALLHRLAWLKPSVFIDAGANVGDWSIAAAQAFPTVTVHSFEIAKATAAELTKNATRYGNRIVVNTVGLGDRLHNATVHVSQKFSERTSVLGAAVRVGMSEQDIESFSVEECTIITGDHYLTANHISKVDFLKIDVEGGELSVLNGFENALSDGKIDIVQFEYGKVNLITRHFLGDFFAFFSKHGFKVGKIYPKGVDFKDYDLSDEDFVGGNYLACRIECQEIIESVRVRR